MPLSRLLIRDFRNIASADLSLSPGFNFLVGVNGSGKTSVLEAIYTLGHGRAFRSQHNGRVIRHEQAAFVLHGRIHQLVPLLAQAEVAQSTLLQPDLSQGTPLVSGSLRLSQLAPAQLQSSQLPPIQLQPSSLQATAERLDVVYGQRETLLGLSKNRHGDSTVKIDGDEGYKVADLAHLLPMQLITPESFTLLNGGPKYRRAFLDWGCFHQRQGFFTAWSQLKRLLKQRNAALRQASHYRQLQHWDQQLIPLAEQISQWREDYSAALVHDITASCQQFLPEYRMSFTFQRGWDKEQDYRQVLENQFTRDRLLAHTSQGPHKADLRIRADGVPVEDSLSRGQLKLLMCALRLAQGDYFTRHSGQHCLYLLDDFASELDEQRRGLLASRLKQSQSQVFVSAISARQIQDMTEKNSKLFMVDQGKIIDNTP